MIGDSWTHKLARVVVRPLIGTSVRPNHITFLRLVSGLAACAFFADGSSRAMWWGGSLWLISAFLDRADGEFARIGNMKSEWGHLFDYHSDNLVNAVFFAAIGVGLRHGWLGALAIPAGLLSAGALLLCNWWSELLERVSPPDTRAYSGIWGFDPDDALYLMGPFAWAGWLSPILLGASLGTTVMMTITGIRLLRRRRLIAA